MKKLDYELISKCRELRIEGNSFGEISSVLGVAKSTLYAYLKDIPLSYKQKQDIEKRRKAKCFIGGNPRKGKCLAGREIIKPVSWSKDLIHIVSHFIFDGRVDEDCCIYYSKDKYQIRHMQRLLEEKFRAIPRIQLRDNGVYGLVFYHVELANYLKRRREELIAYVANGAPKAYKREFIKAFFDDEGCIFYKGDKRRVRGYQKSNSVLELVLNLLKEFGIESRIDKRANGVEISGRSNLEKFSKEINFSSKIYINPYRKNGIWKKIISKRKILGLALQSYK
ncbi:MAG: LAGLIDADG family homing endonuclease [Candidatus Omnitrophota bacterium]